MKVPLYTDRIETNRRLAEYGTDAVPATAGEVLDATAEDAWTRNPLPSLLRWAGRRDVFLREGTRMLSPDEANGEFGIEGHLAWDEPVAEPHARELHDLKRAELKRQDVLSRAEGGLLQGAAQLGLGLLVSAADPINVASAFVPVVGQARYAAWLRGAGGLGGRTGVRLGVGAAEGAVGAALVEPLVYGVARSEQADYDAVDSLVNLAFGTALGGGLHALGGATMDLSAGRYRTPVEEMVERAPMETREAATRLAVVAAADGRPVEGVQEALQLGQPRERRSWRRGAGPSLRAPQAVFDADGRRVMVRYELVEADDLVASHTDDLVENPAFPAELQPRDRTRAAAEAQITDIVANFEPERLGMSPDAATGAPIVDAAGIVESGNGRVLAVRRTYAGDGETAQRYRAFLSAQGFDPRGYRQPVLVRRRLTELAGEERRAFTVAAQKSGTLDLSATERALADAKRLDGILPMLDGGDVGLARNARFVRAFVERLPQADQGAMLSAEGALSLDGKRRIEGAMLARAFDDADLLGRMIETSDDNSRAIAGALLDVAPDWARMRAASTAGEISARVDATADLLAAVRAVRDARAANRPLAEVLSQMDAFDRRSPATEMFLGSLLRVDGEGRARTASREAVAEDLRRFVDQAMRSSPDTDMFGAAPPDAVELLQALKRRAPELAPADPMDVRAVEAVDQVLADGPAEARMDVDDASVDADFERAAELGLVDRNEPELAEAAALVEAAESDAQALRATGYCLGRAA